MQIFPNARNAPVRFGCFGKLPSYADFLSLNIDGPEPQALAAWLQEGIGASPSIGNAHPEQFVHYVWRPESGRRTLVGVLWPSADAAGRRFPFTIFTVLPPQQLAGQGTRLVLAAEAIRTRIHELFTQVMRTPRIRDQYVTIGEAQVPGVPESSEVERVWAERADKPLLRREDAAVAATHVMTLSRIGDELAAAPEIPDFAVRVALLSSDPDTELAVWTQVLCARLREPDLDAGYFLRFARAGTSAYLFHRGLDAPDLAFLLAPSDEYARGHSVGFRPAGGGPATKRLTDALQRTWRDRAPSLRSVLDLSTAASPQNEATTGEACEVPTDHPVKSRAPIHHPQAVLGALVAPAPLPAVATAGPSAITVAPEEEPDTDEIVLAPPAEKPGATIAVEARAERTPAAIGDLTTAELAARIETLTGDAVLPGRLVRASAAASAQIETVETNAGESVLLYLDDSGAAAILTGLDANAVRGVERRIAAWREARELLTELGRRHRALEERLDRALADAGARSARPGSTA